MSGAAHAAPLLGRAPTDRLNLHVHWWVWAITGGVVVLLLLVDLLVVHRHEQVLTLRRALAETGGWLAIALTVGVCVGVGFGGAAAGQWFSGYLVELSLSVDNVFIWAVILSYFNVPRMYQHRVLFWGVFGAVLLRAGFVFGGLALVNRFEAVLVGFGAFLLYTAFKLLRSEDAESIDPERNVFLRAVRRVVPSTTDYDGHRLFTVRNGRRLATPLFAVLVLVETTDLLFAVDSVPAVLGVSREAFVVLSSNAFAILGLRSLYFLLADLHARFTYLRHGLALILAFVGGKMIVERWVHVPEALSLAVIAAVLAASVTLSVLAARVRASGSSG